MSKLIKNNKYLGYTINNKVNKKTGIKYDINRKCMQSIVHTLNRCKNEMIRPKILRFTLSLDNNDTFDLDKFTRKLREYKYSYGLIYSFEYAEKQKGLHLELGIIIDQFNISPDIFRRYLIKVVANLDGIEYEIVDDYTKISLNHHNPKNEAIKGSGHNLKDENEFSDAVYRYSYLAKQNDKELVNRKKKFGTAIRIK
jgi:hypothetical protein